MKSVSSLDKNNPRLPPFVFFVISQRFNPAKYSKKTINNRIIINRPPKSTQILKNPTVSRYQLPASSYQLTAILLRKLGSFGTFSVFVIFLSSSRFVKILLRLGSFVQISSTSGQPPATRDWVCLGLFFEANRDCRPGTRKIGFVLRKMILPQRPQRTQREDDTDYK
jgi:hypothetical protein